jgi:hypothetical protein
MHYFVLKNSMLVKILIFQEVITCESNISKTGGKFITYTNKFLRANAPVGLIFFYSPVEACLLVILQNKQGCKITSSNFSNIRIILIAVQNLLLPPLIEMLLAETSEYILNFNRQLFDILFNFLL